MQGRRAWGYKGAELKLVPYYLTIMPLWTIATRSEGFDDAKHPIPMPPEYISA